MAWRIAWSARLGTGARIGARVETKTAANDRVMIGVGISQEHVVTAYTL